MLVLQNNAPVTKNATALPPLLLAESDEENNEPYVLSLPLANSDYEESDPQACPLPLVDIGEEEKNSNDTSVTSHGSIFDLGRPVKNFFQGLGGFYGEVVDAFLDDGNTQMYTIIFTNEEEEMWSANNATVNVEAASFTVGDCGFQLVRKFCGGGHFSGTVVEILCGGKRKCKFCDIDEYKYMLSEFNTF